MRSNLTRWLRSDEPETAVAPVAERDRGSDAPVCFIVDVEEANRNFMSLVLQGYGIETGQFADGRALRDGLARKTPDLIFLDVPIDAGEAVEAVHAIGERKYRGPLQLMSGRAAPIVENVRRVASGYSLLLPPPLKKPIDRSTIIKVVNDHNLDLSIVTAVQGTSLEEALRGGWIEFWYQPKIDLRKKQLVGVETFARARHPEHGVMSPGAFMPGAEEKCLVILAQESIINALRTGLNFSKMGINLRLAVNVSVAALTKLPVEAIVREFRPKADNWPGLLFDVTEDQIAGDLAKVREIAEKLAGYGVRLAIDDFGRGFLPLAKLKEVPFVELKLDRAFVNDCATDKSNAAICKSVIDLAHNFGSMAVAVGVEKPADAVELFRMGCDVGQGYLFAQPMAEDRFLTLLRQRAEKAARPAVTTH